MTTQASLGLGSRRIVVAVVAAALAAVGCAQATPTSGETGGDGGSSGATTGGGGSSTTGGGGSSGTTGGGGGGTTGADGGVVSACSNTDKTIMPMDATGWIPRECTSFQVQGAWYCYSDGMGTTDCVTGRVPFKAGSGMCISGTTSTNTAGYGAGVGVELNSSGGTASVKSAYNAQMNNIIGFDITIAGTAGTALRLGFTPAATSSGPAPFVALPGPGSYRVLFADAVVPGSWQSPTAGTRVTPASIFDVQLAIPINATPTSYNYCITSLKPIMSGTNTAPTGACANYGASVCGLQDLMGGMGSYAVQNNVNTGAPGTQCVQATAGNNCGGFTATFNGFGNSMAMSPYSYPSVIYGWQAGSFYGAYRTAKQVSGIGTATSSWSFNAPTSGKWNASYDIWFSPQAAPTTANGGLELMIWPNYGGNAQPVGTMSGTVNLASATWEVWTGTVSTWKYIAYRRQPGSSTAFNGGVDLKPFFNDAVSRGSLQAAWYLLGIQAGFEVWQYSGSAGTTSFSASVN